MTTKRKPKGRVSFKQDLCKGCGLCVSVCPVNILALDRGKVNAKGYNPSHARRPEDCIGCMSCALMCPDTVITVERLDLD